MRWRLRTGLHVIVEMKSGLGESVIFDRFTAVVIVWYLTDVVLKLHVSEKELDHMLDCYLLRVSTARDKGSYLLEFYHAHCLAFASSDGVSLAGRAGCFCDEITT